MLQKLKDRIGGWEVAWMATILGLVLVAMPLIAVLGPDGSVRGQILGFTDGFWRSDYPVRVDLPEKTAAIAPRLATPEADEALESEGEFVLEPVEELATVERPDGAVQTRTAPKLDGVMDVRFRLAPGRISNDQSNTDPVRINRPVSIGGRSAGSIALLVQPDGTLMARPTELGALFPEGSETTSRLVAEGPDFVPLDRLRALGIAIRYDAANDGLAVSGR